MTSTLAALVATLRRESDDMPHHLLPYQAQLFEDAADALEKMPAFTEEELALIRSVQAYWDRTAYAGDPRIFLLKLGRVGDKIAAWLKIAKVLPGAM